MFVIPMDEPAAEEPSTSSSDTKWFVTEDNDEIISWLKNRSLLMRRMDCPFCSLAMRWIPARQSTIDRYSWNCINRHCLEKRSQSVRKGSIFQPLRIELSQWMLAIDFWLTDRDPQRVDDKYDNPPRSLEIVQAYKLLNDVCKHHFEEYPITLGGPECKLDMRKFTYNIDGSEEHSTVVGVVDTSAKVFVGYAQVLENEGEDSLGILRKVAASESTIFCTYYRNIKEQQNREVSNTSKYKFVDRIECDGSVLIKINAYWASFNDYVHAFKYDVPDLQAKLAKRMWIERHKNRLVPSLCAHISAKYKVDRD